MEIKLLVMVAISLAIIIVMVFLSGKMLQYFYNHHHKKAKYFKVQEVLYLDPSTRVVHVTHKTKNYILMIGKNNERIIEIYEN